MSYEEGDLFSMARKQLHRSYEKVASVISKRGSPGIEDQILGIAVRIGRAKEIHELIELHKNGGRSSFLSAHGTLEAELKMYTGWSSKCKHAVFKAGLNGLMRQHQVGMRKVSACGKFCKQLIADLENMQE